MLFYQKSNQFVAATIATGKAQPGAPGTLVDSQQGSAVANLSAPGPAPGGDLADLQVVDPPLAVLQVADPSLAAVVNSHALALLQPIDSPRSGAAERRRAGA